MAKDRKRGAKKKKLRNKKTGTAERLDRFGNRPAVRIAYFVIVAILGAIVALAAFGDDMPGALQTLRESGRLRSRCEFDPAAEGEALILILPFYVTSGGHSNAHVLIHEAIEDKIKDLEEEIGLENVSAEIASNVILQSSDREAAQELGESCNAAVVIWGTETEAYVQVNFLNIKEPQAYASFEIVRVLAPKDLTTTKIIVEHLPGQLAFLAMFAVGQAVVTEGDFTRAISILEEAVNNISERLIKEGLASPDSAAAAYLRLGWLYSFPPTQDFEKAIDALEKSLAFGFTYSDALINLGNVYFNMGDYETATDYYEEAIAIARENSDTEIEGAALGNLGAIYWILEQENKAIDYHERSLAIARENSNRKDEGIALGNLGAMYLTLRQYETAKDYLEKAVEIARETDDLESEKISLGNLGFVYKRLEDYETAKNYLEEALAIAQETGDLEEEGGNLEELGNVHASLGQYKISKDYLNRSMVVARETGDREGEGRLLGKLGLIHSRLGEYERAKGYLEESISILEAIEPPLAEYFQHILDDLKQEANRG